MQNLKPFALHVTESLLFCFAFFMIVPPVSSQEGHEYSLTPALIIGGGAFTVSMLLGYRRGAEHPLTIVLKLLFYVALAWIVHERVDRF